VKRLAPRSRPLLEGLGLAAVDTVMNLFIFFLVAFSLLATFQKKAKENEAEKQRVHELQLPPSHRDAPPIDPALLVLDISEGGEVVLDGEAVEREGLIAALKRRLAERRRGVVVRADRRLSLGATVAVLDLVWAADPPSVSVATVDRRP